MIFVFGYPLLKALVVVVLAIVAIAVFRHRKAVAQMKRYAS